MQTESNRPATGKRRIRRSGCQFEDEGEGGKVNLVTEAILNIRKEGMFVYFVCVCSGAEGLWNVSSGKEEKLAIRGTTCM